MSDQIPQTGVPYKLPAETFQLKLPQLQLPQFAESGTFPWVKAAMATEEEKLNSRVQEIQNSLRPDVPKLSDEFIKKVVIMADELKCDAKDLLAIMYHESGGWNPSIKAKDKKGNVYGGLIQMTPDSLRTVAGKYAKELNLKKNISMQEYLRLPREKQLDYAKGYFTMLKDSCNLSNRERLTAGETWGMLKSPNKTKNKNQQFLNRLSNFVAKIRNDIFLPEYGRRLNVKN